MFTNILTTLYFTGEGKSKKKKKCEFKKRRRCLISYRPNRSEKTRGEQQLSLQNCC